MKSSGSTSEQSRIYNERIILHLVRQHPEISRVKIAEQTGLSAQTISVITSSLLERQLLQVDGKVKGRRGQPSIKLSINKKGAYGLGINVDRDHISAALLDFSGECVLLLERIVSFPTENLAKKIAQDLIEEVKTTLGEDWSKVQGIGLARPDYMDSWLETLVTDSDQRADLSNLKAALAYWQSDAFESWLTDLTGVPCFCENDAVAAATSELLLASVAPQRDFFYLFVSTACGGSFVANGECYFGAHGKAGSFGLIPTATGKHGKWILEALSLSSLRRFFADKQIQWPSTDDLWLEPQYTTLIEQWASEVAFEVTPALASVVALYDPEAILIGGRLPPLVLAALIICIENALTAHSMLPLPAIRIAQTGHTAGVLGAAVLPLYGTFAPQQNLLLLSSKSAVSVS
ncbi:Sugar kinase of the NBD/HSP70 family, may contain an N-terminal HTH domain [Marinomonas polaris DSM 16579]|uniref:Sugar kinase of the NBD/HSP70 family, may contain an N-terminal HTH domain n=1 Tax=Marinomonas polaris DSM 16579 TaxID=1122206 RepID=A0A1M5K4B2_9GAMM|nr:ROK family transcriptional regulator [Marinomonas polaris]SHG47551.1 Sugar kinase of the NBD/HSP70 family, may contain an N-terminal HTH domain [Marinomonas polaris DSM 16579]|tara:strand:+ start:7678 stop:8892 length:1215 start_codon:yes stop_codon:yes gene_type:complete